MSDRPRGHAGASPKVEQGADARIGPAGRRLKLARAVVRRGLYQGWIGNRNLGDEAIFQACVQCLPRIRWTPLPFDHIGARSLAPASLRNAWHRELAALLPGRVALLGGGTVVNRSRHWLEQYRLLRRKTGRPVPVLAPGVADAAFWSTVPGWFDMRAEWCAALAELPEVGVRGPMSKWLLEQAGLRNVMVTGDPALSFHRAAASRPGEGRHALAVNVRCTDGLMWGREDAALAAIAEGVARLHASGFSVRFFPMGNGDADGCREVARRAGLTKEVVDPLVLNAHAFLEYLERFDVVLSVRLHGAVLAAAAGVPFVAVEYQPKVSDFTESIGWGEYTLRTDTIAAAQVERTISQLYHGASAARARLDERVGVLAAEFRAYARRTEEYLLAS